MSNLNSSISERIISYILLDVFRFKIPKARQRVSRIIEKRKTNLDAKKVKGLENFSKDYNKLVKPYWKRFGVKPNKNAFKVYWAENGKRDVRYIPNEIWIDSVLPCFNNVYEYRILGDKAVQELFIKGIVLPETIIKRAFGVYYDGQFNPLSTDEVCEKIRTAKQIVIKQSFYSYGGMGVSFINTEKMSDSEIIETLNEYKEDIIVQKPIKQHPELSKINDSSINTIRFVTFYYKEEVRILSSVLRIGGKDSKTDNITSGGFACGIHEDGRLFDKAISRATGWVSNHPNGVAFRDIVIPNYESIVERVKYAAQRVPYFKIIGWDIAVNENGEPVYVEFNARPEQNQKIFGPTFADLTDDVLNEVYNKKE